ncbi:MAG: thiamine ABC transporter substrate-binding protein [Spirochaetales bacterium]|nr:thiamine ABC transporter substrate-binding protein [Spirochaetales bacterium]
MLGKKARTALFLLLLICIVVLLGFGGQEQKLKNEESGQYDKLTIYSYDAFPEALEESIRNHFAGDETLSVELIRFEDTGGLFNQVYLERMEPVADVVIGLDNTYLSRILEEEIFQPYEPADLDLINPGLLVDGGYRAIPFDYGSVTLNYDSELLESPPESWDDLVDPRFKGQIILMNPATSSPGRNFLLFTIVEFGEDKYLEFWKNLKPNILTVTAGWSEGYGLYTQGEAPIVLSYDTSPAYHLHYEKTDRYKNIFFEGKAYAQIEIAGITNGAKNVNAARMCIDFIVSKTFQDLIPLNQIMYPVRSDAELPDAFIQSGSAEIIVNMNEKTVAERFDGWLRGWEAVMR